MKVQFKKFVNTVDQSIELGVKLRTIVDEITPMYNKADQEERNEVRNAIAIVVSKRTGVKYITLEKGIHKGTYGFKAKHTGGTDKSEASRKLMEFYLPETAVRKEASKASAHAVTDPDAGKLTTLRKWIAEGMTQRKLDSLFIKAKAKK